MYKINTSGSPFYVLVTYTHLNATILDRSSQWSGTNADLWASLFLI